MPYSREIKRLLRLFGEDFLLGAAVLALFIYGYQFFFPEKLDSSIITEINKVCILGLRVFYLITAIASIMGAINWIDDDGNTFGLCIGLRLSQIGIILTLLGKLYSNLPNQVFYRSLLCYCFTLAIPAITALVKSKR